MSAARDRGLVRTRLNGWSSSRRPSALVVAYCFPPHAAIGTHQTLRLISHLASHGWHVRVLTVRPKDFLAGTPVDERLLERIAQAWEDAFARNA